MLRLAVNLHRPFAPSGDAAIIELSVRRALDGVQLLGPYSRFGFEQPGPAAFYAQAPFYWLGGASSRSPYLLTWASVLLLPGCIAAAALGLRPGPGTKRHRAGTATAVIALIPSDALTAALLRGADSPVPSSATVEAATELALSALDDFRDDRGVRLRPVHNHWPTAAGLLVELTKAGVGVSIDEWYEPLFGRRLVGHGDGSQETILWLTDAAGPPPPADPPPQRVGVAGEVVLWAGRRR